MKERKKKVKTNKVCCFFLVSLFFLLLKLDLNKKEKE